ncbi:MAG TPA: UDP-N-acetylmuramoyl-tripeptide--D-alanyl-D-alanine ligase [Kiritimatiellia bacterium]|nr:UDP-N-acetylmuramoyl-tripeptide--D-alanyl-D-alanine ligase [Kiritimatiellia bacterium]
MAPARSDGFPPAVPPWPPDVIARWSGGIWQGTPPPLIRGFSFDTRSIRPGDLFLALRGETRDGHDYISDALARGAVGTIVDRDDVAGGGAPLLRVASVREALGRIATGHRQTLTLERIAVTGSFGKTTVKELLAAMLSTSAPTVKSQGNWNNDLGLPMTLLATTPAHRFGVYEVGMNHPGELDPLCAILAPRIGIVTGVGPVHLEAFDSIAGIAHEKAAVCRCLPPDGLAILPLDDPWFQTLSDHATAPVRTVSLQPGRGDYTLHRDPATGWIDLHENAAGETCRAKPSLEGAYFALDAGLAAAAARACGIPWSGIVHAIETYHPLPLRWERHDLAGCRIVNDAYNANPVSMRAAIEALLETAAEGTLWLVLGGMLELGPEEELLHRELGDWIASKARVRLITLGARAAWIGHGAAAAGMKPHPVTGPVEAARILHDHARPGDHVLLKGSRGEAVERVLHHWKTLLS